MKKLISIAFIILCINIYSQAPQKFSYQAVIRNSSNELVIDKMVTMKISILQGSVSGKVIFSELQTPTTNTNGLVSIEIGSGTVQEGSIAGIDWANGPYFIKTETDPKGGTEYTINGTSQLLSVPYAMYASSAGTIYEKDGKYGFGVKNPSSKYDLLGINGWDLINTDGDFKLGDNTYKLKIGVALGGGGAGAVGIMQYGVDGGYNVMSLGSQGKYLLCLNGTSGNVGVGTNMPVAKLEVKGNVKITDGTQGAGKVLTSDSTGMASWQSPATTSYKVGDIFGGGMIAYLDATGHHGLIVADGNYITPWTNNETPRVTNALSNGLYAGAINTAIIIASQMDTATGNFAAKTCVAYLPLPYNSVYYGNWYLPSKYELELIYNNISIINVNPGFKFKPLNYWSSTEYSDQNAWYINFGNGNASNASKNSGYYVRPVRAF